VKGELEARPFTGIPETNAFLGLKEHYLSRSPGEMTLKEVKW